MVKSNYKYPSVRDTAEPRNTPVFGTLQNPEMIRNHSVVKSKEILCCIATARAKPVQQTQRLVNRDVEQDEVKLNHKANT